MPDSKAGRKTIWVLLALLAVPGCGHDPRALPVNLAPRAAAKDPAHASYLIGEDAVSLVEGMAVRPAAPGAAEKVETSLFGMPEWGDLDGDGDEDAAVLLIQRTGGSGSFHYVAAALSQKEGFSGTNAVLLGDRVAPQTLQIRNGVILASYAERAAAQPMSAAPTEARTKYLSLSAGKLVETPPFDAGVQVVEGWVTIGHEVRALRPCGQKASVWLDPASPGFQAIRQAYEQALPPIAPPYTPVFMTLAGRLAAAPIDGFGRDYGASFQASQWLQAWPRGNCRADRIRVTTPLAGSVVRSPLLVSGRARGPWFFEADFPVHLKDSKGRVVATAIAKAQAPWMTREFVAFEAILHFDTSAQPSPGTLVLVKNNPSDDRSLDDAAELPVFYH
jgi:hypothetical protein